jgi:hypothetical protein
MLQDNFLQVSSARRLVNMSGKIYIFNSIFRLLPIVGSDSFIHPRDRDDIKYPKMVSHVQIRRPIHKLGCSEVKKTVSQEHL